MAEAQVTYTGDGATSSWAFSFPYLDESHVKLYIDGVEDVSKTFPTASSVQASSTPSNGAVVLIARETPRATLYVSIPTSGSLRNSDLNTQAKQALYVSVEARDRTSAGLALDASETYYDATSKQIRDLADPTSAQHAATKNYVDTEADSQVVQAAASASAAASSASAASSSASAASTSASNASTSASNASTSETNAGLAQTAAEAAQSAAETAETNAETAQTAAETAQTNAETAETGAEAAQTAAEAAQAAAELAADNFDDTYLGAKASDPALDNDGGALTAGDLYFNTASNQLKVYTGSVWQVAAVSTAGFPTLAGNNDWTGTNVFQNGSLGLGVDDTTRGELSLFGAATANGGSLYFYQAADEDTSVDWQRIYADAGYLDFTDSNGNSQMRMQASGGLLLSRSTGEVGVGLSDTVPASVSLHGGPTFGADLRFFQGASEDALAGGEYFHITADGGELLFRDDANAAALIIQADKKLRLPNTSKGMAYVDDSGVLQAGEWEAHGSNGAAGAVATVNFGSIPSWVSEIQVHLDGVSHNTGSALPIVQLGDSGGVEATGYSAGSYSASTTLESTSAFLTRAAAAAATNTFTGVVYLRRVTGNLWSFESGIKLSSSGVNYGSGVKELSGTLTQVQVGWNTAATFDAGSLNVYYR